MYEALIDGNADKSLVVDVVELVVVVDVVVVVVVLVVEVVVISDSSAMNTVAENPDGVVVVVVGP